MFKISYPNNMDFSKILNDKLIFKIFFLIGAILLYLMIQTGFHGDDYSVMNQWDKINFFQITPENLGLKIFGLPDYFTFWWAYPFLGYKYSYLFDLIKAITHFFSVFLAWRFFSLFFNIYRSLLASLIFVLLPLHDATTYWYMVAAYVFWPAVIMFSFYLLAINKVKLGASLAFIGAFSFYLSPPYIFGLSLIFFLRKEYKKWCIFITPGFLYLLYYFYIKNFYPFVEKRINKDLDLIMFFKGIVLQVLGILDSFVGPSAFLKLYFSATSIGLLSLLIALFVLLIGWVFIENTSENKKILNNNYSFSKMHLILGAISVLLLSLAMFALTGQYVPSPFNLGNRTLVYASLLTAILLTSIRKNKKNLIFIWLVFVLPVLGISDHWKQWNTKQVTIVNNIHNNENLKKLQKEDLLIVTGNGYDNLGPFSHIEFFNMPWVVSSIFRDFANVDNAIPLTQTISLEGNYLLDIKYGDKFLITGNLYIYDSELNIVSPISKQEIQILINNRSKVVRHWVQLFKDSIVEKLILKLSPRLGYLFMN